MAHYYDIVLTLIPASLLGIATVLSIVGIPTSIAVPIGALVASVLIGHAMFVNGPKETVDDVPASANTSSHPVSAD
ncbi:hypothetical protein [Halovivax gelatinilyticus]|uniref:hypothetical protein n=1 Tax=Halovivax gelatinilyticus TaxID=2961597 RepID=UPI0020CA647B|nr:hypothetical protein [Halovivax gelatinilyticus]